MNELVRWKRSAAHALKLALACERPRHRTCSPLNVRAGVGVGARPTVGDSTLRRLRLSSVRTLAHLHLCEARADFGFESPRRASFVALEPMRFESLLLLTLLVSDEGVHSRREPAAPAAPAGGLRAALERLEYQPTEKTGVLSAPNRAQGLRLAFTKDGLAVEEREGGAPLVALGVTAFGRLGDQRKLGGAAARALGESRVERHWDGLVEWFLNQPEGVEHGWTVNEKVAGAGPLVLSVAVSGARTVASDRGALFECESGRVLRYGSLKALDAAGTDLPARMSASREGLRIEVDDTGAIYPIVIDPLLTTSAWTAETNQNGAEFGFSVASAGDVNGDGYSDVVVGAPGFDAGENDEGRVFLYLGSASGLTPTAAWAAESNQATARFGKTVASAGDVNGDGYSDVIVGAPGFDAGGEPDEGRAFLYLGSASGLSLAPAWTAEGNQANAWFGWSVASAGDVNGDGYTDVVVGAPQFDAGENDEGRAFLYLGSASGLGPTPVWTAEANQANARFGATVASAGDVNGDGHSDVLVGANYFDDGEANEGRVFLYAGSASGLGSTTLWTAEGNQVQAEFGMAVASAGDVNGDGFSDVVVGASYFDNGQTDEGCVFLYLGSASGPTPTPAWTAESNQAGALFGGTAASAGDVNGDGFSDLVVAAEEFDNGEANEGRAFLYLGSASSLPLTPAWTVESNQAGAQFGYGAASAGDVNGDGFSDVLVGAPFSTPSVTGGRASLFLGTATGLNPQPAWNAESNLASSWFGVSAASAGDVNGDGYSDVVVGAVFFSNGESGEGRAFLYLGSASGLSLAPAWTAEGNQADAWFGWNVASAGDVNGDGFSDVVVGAPLFDNGETDEGRAFLYLGSATGLSPTPAWTTEGNQGGAALGNNVASAGDVNGDGYSDVVVAANQFDNGQANEGRALLFVGSAGGLSVSPAWTAEGNQADARFATSVASAGDVNGDGYSDVVVGAYEFNNGEADEGRAFVYLGSVSGLSPSAAWTAESNQAGAWFGIASAGAGDVNGDGYSDVVVGARQFDNGEVDEGRAFLYLGGASGLSLTPGWTAESNQAGASFGWGVASAGDVNGDGYSDVVVGAPLFDNGQTDEGRAVVYLGSATGLSATPAWTTESNQADASWARASRVQAMLVAMGIPTSCWVRQTSTTHRWTRGAHSCFWAETQRPDCHGV
jgi:hypothetical protein